MSAPRPRPEILDISPYVGGESTVPGVNRVLKLSSNEGAFGVPPGAQAAYTKLAGEAASLSGWRRDRTAPRDRCAVQAGSGADRVRRGVG